MNGIQEAAAHAQGHRLEPARLLPAVLPSSPAASWAMQRHPRRQFGAVGRRSNAAPIYIWALAELWIKMAPESFGERAGCVWPDGPAGRHFQLFPILKYRRALHKGRRSWPKSRGEDSEPGAFLTDRWHECWRARK